MAELSATIPPRCEANNPAYKFKVYPHTDFNLLARNPTGNNSNNNANNTSNAIRPYDRRGRRGNDRRRGRHGRRGRGRGRRGARGGRGNYSGNRRPRDYDAEPNEKRHRNNNNKTCYNCRRKGHYSSDCKYDTYPNGDKIIICYKCGRSGHAARKCESRFTIDNAPVQPNKFPYKPSPQLRDRAKSIINTTVTTPIPT
eukprot:388131_1